MVTHTTATWHMLNEAKVSFTVNNVDAQATSGKNNEKTKIRVSSLFSLRFEMDVADGQCLARPPSSPSDAS